MKKKYHNLLLRMPLEIRDWLKQEAKDNSRSMNGEIVELMKQAKEKQEEKQIIT